MRHPVPILAFLLTTALASAEAADPKVGVLHPELRLPTIDGTQTVSLRALRGKRVLLLQFASW